jgi:hypothetical protein
MVRIIYKISDSWMIFRDGDLPITVDEKIKKMVEFGDDGIDTRTSFRDKLMQYATLFYQKTESYLKKSNSIMLGDTIMTKLIRMTADGLNQKEQIVLNKSALLSCELDDLFR